ncbi:hypothetical protein SAMD00019534_048590, partial [Acytostelium subglobosum LB1]|uniref:hypothetical protein n=1 Tax=Acytostelium subglobosum LB1 TaxID=1410327 RepID=UPI00064495C7
MVQSMAELSTHESSDEDTGGAGLDQMENTHIPVPVQVVKTNNVANNNRIPSSNLQGIQVEQELEDESFDWKTENWKNSHREYYAFNHPYQPSDTYEDTEYFNSYSKVNIHNEMVFDKRRTAAYYHAIMKSRELFKDKVVMDVGCGTGLLSCFCAMAGAKRVYAVEGSDMAYNTELIVQRNNLQDKVHVYKGKVEHIAFPEYVDIIVSEWMGAFLIFESMLESVIYARDHLLKPNGVLFPSKACLYVAPVRIDEFIHPRIDCWHDVYGLDMSPLIPFAQQDLLNKSIRDHYMHTSNVLDTPFIIRYLDLATITTEELSRTVLNFKFTLPNGSFHGFGTWFSVWFEGLDDEEMDHVLYHIDDRGQLAKKPVGGDLSRLSPQPFELTKSTLELSTAPSAGCTHWRQVIFPFEQPRNIVQSTSSHDSSSSSTAAATVTGTMRVSQHQTYRRHWWIEFSSTQTVNSVRTQAYQN